MRFLHTYPIVFAILICTSLSVVQVSPVFCQTEEPESGGNTNSEETLDDLINMDLEELSEQEIIITSVSKKVESLIGAAAAAYVITQEDIRRSGASEIPELFRMVPGMQVAKIDANTWAISARGFNGEFNRNMLVLIDGRTVYNNLFGGVFWRSHDLIMEDIERIEIIRGPGSALWGANAVNGVINIITKKAEHTQGGLISSTVGTETQGIGGRYGGSALDGELHYRIWAKGNQHDGNKDSFDQNTPDDWDMNRAGFRVDWDVNERDSLSFLGGYYDADVDQLSQLSSLTPPFTRTLKLNEDHFGADFLARWERVISEDEDLSLQLYYDRVELETIFSEYSVDTVDVDFQHRFPLFENNELIWGLKYRLLSDEFKNQQGIIYNPASRDINTFSGFFQDKHNFFDEKLEFTIGTKLEHNDYTGFEVQPSARLAWTPNHKYTTWASITRSVRIPDRTFNDVELPATVIPVIPGDTSGIPGQLVIFGNDSINSENAIATEIGQRIQATDNLSFDLTAFYTVYDDILTARDGTPFFDPAFNRITFPLITENNASAETYGFEIETNIQLYEWWRLTVGYSLLNIDFHLDRNASLFIPNEREAENLNPQNQFHFRSYMNLPWHLEMDTFIYTIENLPGTNVDSILRLDVRLGWRPNENMDLSIGGTNLLDDRHQEFVDQLFTVATETERAYYAKFTWRF